MTEFTPHFSKQKTRRFQVKPAVLLRENTTSEYISRPVKLKILVIRKIVKILETGIVNFSNTEDIPKCLQNAVLTGDSLGFPIISATFCENFNGNNVNQQYQE